jgi:peptidoglycan/xylan/chitin deacetylase (PgdA/CDA1 family)
MLTVGNYHYIREDFSAPFPSIFGLTPEQFKNQLEKLSSFMDFVNPNDFLIDPEKFILSNKNYGLITFDDGLKEQMDLAFPILTELGIPALFFVNTVNFQEKRVSTIHKNHLVRSMISSNELWESIVDEFGSDCVSESEKRFAAEHYNFDDELTACLKYFMSYKLSLDDFNGFIETAFLKYFKENDILNQLYMTKNQLEYLANIGLLGSHTHSHSPLGRLPEKSIIYELENSKNYLETLTSSAIDFVSYPYGDTDSTQDPVSQIAKKSGFKIGFTTKRAINTDESNLLLLSRFDCNDLPLGKNNNQFKQLWKQE